MAWKWRSILAAVILTALPAGAATWYVGSCVGPGGDGTSPATAFCKIQDGVNAAALGDTVRVLPGTYRECVDASIRGGVELIADDYVLNGRRSTTILDGTGVCSDTSWPQPTVALGEATTLEGFTVRGGGLSGVLAFGSVLITKNVIEGNATATHWTGSYSYGGLGGGVMVYSASYYPGATEARIEDNVVRNNHASVSGGGIFVFGLSYDTETHQVRIEGNQVTGNTSLDSGGGIGVAINTQAGRQAEVVITTNTIDGNSAAGSTSYNGDGGGVYATTYGQGSETIRVEGNTVRLNTAYYGGGGVAARIQVAYEGSHSMVVQGNDVQSNVAGVDGGGMELMDVVAELPAASAPAFTVSGNLLQGNHAFYGGGGAAILAVADGSAGTTAVSTPLDFTNNLVAGNDVANSYGDAAGGGVWAGLTAAGDAVVTARLERNTLASNGTDLGGGGINLWVNTVLDSPMTHEGLASVVVHGSIVSDNLGFGIGKDPTPTGSTDNWQASIGFNDVFGNQYGSYENSVGPPPAGNQNLEVDPLLDASFVPDVCSPTIDAAHPADDFSQEPQPNGARTNQGHLGGTGSAVTSLPDTNGDRLVDGVDVLRIASAFASTAAGPRYYAPADLDGNGVVDGDDLAYVAARFGTDCR